MNDRRFGVFTSLVLTATMVGCACSPSGDEPDASRTEDSGALPIDATVLDASAVDAAPDAAALDASASDSGHADSGSPDAGPLEITDPESAIFVELTVRCRQLIACCAPGELDATAAGSVAACVENFVGGDGRLLHAEATSLVAIVEADIAAGRIRFDLAAATSCVERFAALSCEEVGFWRRELYRPHRYGLLCPEAFVGLGDDLTPCQYDHQCVSGGCAHRGPADGTEMLCGALPLVGETCWGRCGEMQAGTSCVGSSPMGPGACVVGAEAGESCVDGRNCAQGLACRAPGICMEDSSCDGVP